MRKFQFFRFSLLVLPLFLMFSFIPIFAAYLTNIPTTITQPDGSKIECFTSGDEFYNWLHDADNYTIIRSPKTGYYTYAEQDGDNIKAGLLVVGRDEVLRYSLSPGINVSDRLYRQKRSIRPEYPYRMETPTKGSFNNLVIFIRFSDQTEFDETIATYEGWFNTNTASMKNYFLETSYNQLTVNNTFYPPAVGGNVVSFQDTLPRGYYLPYDDSTNTIGFVDGADAAIREHTLIVNAVSAVESDIPAGLNIDMDNDGLVDNIVFVIRGEHGEDILWPHKWQLHSFEHYLHSKRVWIYNIQIETFQYTNDASVLCHEFFHSLGAPDLYRGVTQDIGPAGPWDVMAGNRNPPQHMNAHMKWKYGKWISEIPTITVDHDYVLHPATDSLGLAYRIDSPYALNEYFIVEYRRKTGTFDVSIPGSGLVVWRINTDCGNGNYYGPPDEAYIYRPDGELTVQGLIDSAFFSLESGRTEMNDVTNPNSFLSDGSSGGLDILNIGSAGDSITFTKSTPDIDTIEFPPDTYSEGFNDISCPPDGWLKGILEGTEEFQQIPIALNPGAVPYEGFCMLAYPSNSADAGSAAIVSSPRIEISNAIDYQYTVSFRMYRDDGFPSIPDRIEVFYNNSANPSGNEVLLGVIHRSTALSPIETANGWYQYSFTFYPSETGFYHIIFKAISAHGNNIYIDDFVLQRYVLPATTSIWLGTTSYDWFTASNWRNGYLPDSGQDVVIPADTPHPPLIETTNGSCRDLQINIGASLQLQNITLTVNGNASINGNLYMMLTAPKLIVYGNLSFNNSSAVIGTNPEIDVYSSCTINNKTSFEMDSGLLKLTGSNSSGFTCNTPTITLDNLTIQKFGATVYHSQKETSTLVLMGDLVVANGANYTAVTDTCYIVTFGNNLTSYGDLRMYVGTISFRATAMTVNLAAASFLKNIEITNGCNLTLASDLDILGSMLMPNGTLDATNRTIEVEGDWYKSSSSTFTSTGSTVIFDGYSKQECSNSDFDNLVLYNGADSLYIGYSQMVTANSYDYISGTMEVKGGTFTALDIADSNIKGSYKVSSGGKIYLTQDSSHYTDLDADITMSGGEINIYGGIHYPVDWAYTRDITLDLSGGSLIFHDNGIHLTETGHELNALITGGTIRIGGSFIVDRIGFYPAGGTIELIGTDNAVVSQHIASSLYNLKINKGSRNESVRSSSRSNSVTFTGNTIIDNDLNIYSGNLDLDSVYVSVGGDLDVYGSLTMTNEYGVLDVYGSAIWHNGSTNTITAGAINVGRNLTLYDDINLNMGTGNTFSLVSSQTCNLSLYDDDASFGNLVIDKVSSEVYMGSGGNRIEVSGNMTITGESQVELENTTGTIDSLLSVEGILTCGSGSIMSIQDIYLSGSLIVDDADVFILDDFAQETWGTLTIDDGSFNLDAPYTGALFGFAGAVNLNGGVLQITNEGIQFGPSSMFTQTGGTLKIGWGFRAISPNVFMPSAGYVEFIGARSAEIQCNNGNYFHNLTFNKPSTSNAIYFMTDLTVNNDLRVQGGTPTLMHHTLNVNRDVLITGGRLSANNEDDIINVGRNWNNTYGAIGFAEGSGTVNFISELDATISAESFNIVNVNKPTQGPDLLHLYSGATVIIDSTLNISVGCLKMDDGSTLHVNDDIFISDYSGLNISSAGTDNTLYLRGNLYDYSLSVDATHGFTAHPNSTVIFDGDSTQVLYGAYSSMTFNSVSVNKSSGSVMHSNDIVFTGNLEIINGEWSYAVPDKAKSFFGDLYIETGGSFTDSTGTCSFLGNTDGGLRVTGLAKMPNISILKSAENYLYLNGSATFAGHTDISMLSGIFTLNTHTLQFKGTLTLSEECTFSMYNGSVLSLGDSSSVNFGYGTSFIGVGLLGDPATITSYDGNYAFNVGSDASISTEYAVFENMDFIGINIEPGALVDSLHCFKNCTFQNGYPDGSLLSFNPSQDLIIHNAVFPANTGGCMYNVSRYNPLGDVYIMDATGAFADSLYEYDLNGNVFWTYTVPPSAPQNLQITSALGEAILTWDAVSGATGYRIYRSFTPDVEITGVEVDTTELTTWSDEDAGTNPAAFYMVRAYIEYREGQVRRR